MAKFKNLKIIKLVLIFILIHTISLADNHNIYEILQLIQKDLKTLERAVYSDENNDDNNEILKNSIKWSDKIICSWGRFGFLKERDLEIIQLIKKYKTPTFHLGLTKNNQPKHLLYISYNKILTKWF